MGENLLKQIAREDKVIRHVSGFDGDTTTEWTRADGDVDQVIILLDGTI